MTTRDLLANDFLIATFYHFAAFPACAAFQPVLKKVMQECDVRGTVLVTPEGINGTLSGMAAAVNETVAFLQARPELAGMDVKYTPHHEHVFDRVKVKCRQEAITFKQPVDAARHRGEYVDPKDWNALISDPDVVLIDTRNDYEYYVGTFRGALNPRIKHFTELAAYLDHNLDPARHKKVAMFCTGGVRCEKSTAYLVEQGFEHVYHLKGGIIKYLQDVAPEQSLWEGDCYVFDARIAIDHHFTPTYNSKSCPACGAELSTMHRSRPEHIPGKQCMHCAPSATPHREQSLSASACDRANDPVTGME